MSVDIKDITDLIPFIIRNIDKCAFIMALCLIGGLLLGKFIAKIDSKSKKQLKADIIKLAEENSQLKSDITKLRSISDNAVVSPLMPLSNLEKLLDTKTGTLELSALIELKYSQHRRNEDLHS